MEAILIHPKNKQQLKAIKMDFETTDSTSPYRPEFVQKILKGREDVKKGKGVKIAVKDL